VFDMKNNEWNSEVHTPVVYKGHMFAVGKKKRGLFTCLGFDGKEVWTSEGKASFGLGSFLLADGMFFALDGDTGKLRLIEAGTAGYNELASAQVLAGEEVWGPMALSDGKLVLRDLTQMVCLDVRG
jgi:outer membrane protein assembly factor BamB